MLTNKQHYLATAALAGLLLLSGAAPGAAQQQQAQSVRANQLAGTVTGPNGPEAGVWVIAETTDLPTKFAKVVVTDDQGRYLIPDMPKARYDVWVRGYGLVDSPKVKSEPGKRLNLGAVPAPNARAAADYYPAQWWFSMLKIPAAKEFPGTGPQGNGIGNTIRNQGIWLDGIKTDGCVTCHQLGNKATRTLSPQLGQFDRSADAWARRIASGQAGSNMVTTMTRLGPDRALTNFGDWTDRIAEGEIPKSAPPRPQGLERNLVLSIWDWSNEKAYMHDEIASDRRNPRVNANGIIWGTPELSTDLIPALDPKHHKAYEIKFSPRDANTPTTHEDPVLSPSVYWGSEKIWDSQVNLHNPMYDEKGRVWFSARIRGPQNPAFCQKGSEHPSAKLFPTSSANRQLIMYDQKTKKFTHIDTCFTTHHIQFDKKGVLWASSGAGTNDVVGWFDVKKWEKTGDAQGAQGWAPMVLDTNGNGKRDNGFVEPNQPVDPAKDKRVRAGLYGIAPNPVDGSIWGSTLGFPGAIVHVIPGKNPPETTVTEYFEAPYDPKQPSFGFSPRGMDIDSKGVVWAPLASGHLASFDRSKCKGPMNGPKATGAHCPEGWTLYPFPGPNFENVAGTGSAESSYFDWVDQHNTLGLGKDIPIATGNQSDSLLVLKDGKWIVMRVPYPLGFFAKGLDGRIDDEKAGWKGRGVWSASGNRTPAHIEGGKGTRPKVIHFQMRPNPLAG